MFFVAIALIVCGSLWASYSFYGEGKNLDNKISAKQIELARIIHLKEAYLSGIHRLEKVSAKGEGQRAFSLSRMEELVARTFIGGRLTMLKPSTFKEQNSAARASIEIKISNAPLNEALSFLKEIEIAGLFIRKVFLTVPQNQTAVDLYAVITER